jgi:predicted  nucleic acid-binding Zn-ribbon protein
MKNKMSVLLTLLLISTLLLTACSAAVPQKDYDALETERDALVTERDAAVAELNASQKEIDDLQEELDTALEQIDDMQGERDSALAELDDIQDERDSALAEVKELQDGKDSTLAQVQVLQDEINGLKAERDTTQAEITSLKAEIEDLQEQIGTSAMSLVAEEAWETAEERYKILRGSIDFNLEGLAPWVELPEKPSWFDSVHICSTTLVKKSDAFEAVCIISIPGQKIFMSLSDYEEMKTVVCRGGSKEYVTTFIKDEDGNIVEIEMLVDKSSTTLSWTEVEGEELFKAVVAGQIYEVPWSEDAAEFESFCSDFIKWLGSIGRTGGLVAASDQPIMFLGMGVLSNLSGKVYAMGWLEIVQRIVTDFMEGVPASCY